MNIDGQIQAVAALKGAAKVDVARPSTCKCGALAPHDRIVERVLATARGLYVEFLKPCACGSYRAFVDMVEVQ